MPATPLVSVVVPCLNRAEWLKPTLESILGQDYAPLECIVVDGGSKDSTIDVLKSYGDSLRWVSEPDEGHADAINKGWRLARGEILAWLNADDLWKVPDAVRTAVDFLAAHPGVDVVYGDCHNVDLEGRDAGPVYQREWDLAYAVEHCDHSIPQPAAFLRRRILEKVGWLDVRFYQKKDHDLWLRIGLAGNIRHLPRLLAYARNQRGMSFEGQSVAQACVAVTRKFFSLPGVPAGLAGKRRRAMSRAYLRGMEYAWIGGRHAFTAIGYLFQAFLWDPLPALNFVISLPYRLFRSSRMHR